MTKLNKWVLIEAGHDEDDCDIDVGIIGVYDSEAEAKEELEATVEDNYGSGEDEDDYDDCGYDISWSDNDTKVTITSGDGCSDWCKVYKIEEI